MGPGKHKNAQKRNCAVTRHKFPDLACSLSKFRIAYKMSL